MPDLGYMAQLMHSPDCPTAFFSGTDCRKTDSLRGRSFLPYLASTLMASRIARQLRAPVGDMLFAGRYRSAA